MLTSRSRILVWLAAGASLIAILRIVFSHAQYQYLVTDQRNVPYKGTNYAPNLQAQHGLLTFQEAQEHCHRRRLEAYERRDQRRKVFDLFLVNTELDWAEIRLNELNEEVDYFVILESPETFQADPKPLYFADQIHHAYFQKFESKIVHRVVNFTGVSFKEGDTWAREHFTRNALFDQALASLTGEQAPSQGDVLVVGDIDEIPRPGTLATLRNCAFPPRVTLRSHMYYYSFQWYHRGDWMHPQATYFNGFENEATIRPEDLRSGAEFGKQYMELYNAAWHCSSAMSSLQMLINKIRSFSHKAYNHPYILNETKLVSKVRNGDDIFERPEENFDRVDGNRDLPAYLQRPENQERFKYMLDRDPANANFQDVST